MFLLGQSREAIRRRKTPGGSLVFFNQRACLQYAARD